MGEVVTLKLTLTQEKKKEYSPYFYTMAQECVTLIAKRQNNDPYALGLPREMVKQFSRQTVALRRSFSKFEAAEETRRMLVEANRSSTFLQSKLGTLAFMPFPYSAEMERLFTDITSLLIVMERMLSPILIRPTDVYTRQQKY
jgi:hypothetical protein